MYEVELKAWTYALPTVIEQTSLFATYLETIDKNDQYYRLEKPDGSHMSVRIRKELISHSITPSPPPEERTTVTYKKKETRMTSENIPFEVNEEHEFTVSDASECELVLLDSGYVKSHCKHKIAHGYQFENYHIELCSIEGLGDFIEIETFSETGDAAVVSELQKQLEFLIERCGGKKNDIERRYYSELLAEKASKNIQ